MGGSSIDHQSRNFARPLVRFPSAAVVMADYSGLSKGMRLQVESGGTWYAAEVLQVKKGGKAPVKVQFVGYGAEYAEFVGADRIRSKALSGGSTAPKAKETKAKETKKDSGAKGG